MAPRFVALIYVNRSGSTYLSRLIDERFDDVFVFPELSFPLELLIASSLGRIVQGAELYLLIKDDVRIDSLNLSDAQLHEICRKNSSAEIPNLLEAIATVSSGNTKLKRIVIKLENLLYVHDEMFKTFQGLKVIHLIRDPRAVASSMLRSPVPEKPGFNMARGSVVFAARHWRRYIKAAEKVAERHPVLPILYEALKQDQASVFEKIGNFIQIQDLNGASAAQDYRISNIDKNLHPNIYNKFQDERVNAWSTELSGKQIRFIERICSEAMGRYGYREAASSRGRKPIDMAVMYISYGLAGLSHIIRTIPFYVNGSYGKGAASKRFYMFYLKYKTVLRGRFK